MNLMVPRDPSRYPTLGSQVCDFIETNMVYGPGDLRGEPVVLDDEQRGLIYRMYEVFPRDHQQSGRRRFRRVGISLAKGLRKTELAAFIAICELHPEAPVRCIGWTRDGQPIGGGVTDPYIPLVAYTEEQSDELCFGAMRVILNEGSLKDDFLVGIERIERKRGGGVAVSLSSNPNARDGARTTFSVNDETHRWTLERLRNAHKVMLNNTVKRKKADPWTLEITTAFQPGENSVAERTMEYAQAVAAGKVADSTLFFFHRQSGDQHDLTTAAGARAAVIEASGTSWEWRDIDGIVALWADPTTDRSYWERVWCNRPIRSALQAFDVPRWKELAEPKDVHPGSVIVIGFDGSQFHDSTGIRCTEVATGYQWTAGLWERPQFWDEERQGQWQVAAEEVDAVIAALFERFIVWRMYADPPYWQSWVAKWKGQYKTEDGKDRVVEWWTNRRRPMAAANENFLTSIKDRHISHDGDPAMTRHLGNSRKDEIPGWRDEQGKALWLIRKERPDSPNKIDLTMAAILSWEARTDAIAAGALVPVATPQFQMMILGAR